MINTDALFIVCIFPVACICPFISRPARLADIIFPRSTRPNPTFLLIQTRAAFFIWTFFFISAAFQSIFIYFLWKNSNQKSFLLIFSRYKRIKICPFKKRHLSIQISAKWRFTKVKLVLNDR